MLGLFVSFLIYQPQREEAGLLPPRSRRAGGGLPQQQAPAPAAHSTSRETPQKHRIHPPGTLLRPPGAAASPTPAPLQQPPAVPAARSGATRPPRCLPSPPPALPVSGRGVLAALRQPHAGGAARCRRDGARAPLPPLSGPSAWLLRARRAAPRFIYRRGGCWEM